MKIFLFILAAFFYLGCAPRAAEYCLNSNNDYVKCPQGVDVGTKLPPKKAKK